MLMYEFDKVNKKIQLFYVEQVCIGLNPSSGGINFGEI